MNIKTEKSDKENVKQEMGKKTFKYYHSPFHPQNCFCEKINPHIWHKGGRERIKDYLELLANQHSLKLNSQNSF